MTLSGRHLALFTGLALAAQLSGCGAKGPPRAPLVRVPEPVSALVVQRMGDEIFIGFTLPAENLDGDRPADLERVEVYAMTIQPHVPADRRLELDEFQDAATLVATVEVAAPQSGPSAAVTGTDDRVADLRPAQGSPVVFSETLTADLLTPVDPWAEERRRRLEEEAEEEEPTAMVPAPLMTPPQPGPLQRRYAVVGVSSSGRESEPPERVAVSLAPAPFAPSPPTVTYGEDTVDVAWALPVGVRLTVQERATTEPDDADDSADSNGSSAASTDTGTAVAPATPVTPQTPGPAAAPQTPTPPQTPGQPVTPQTPVAPPTSGAPVTPDAPALPPPVLASTSIVEWPPASRYELYEVAEPEDDRLVMPRPLTETALTAAAYTDPRVEFGVERCYAVLTLDVISGYDLRSALSPSTCVTFVDTFPPEAPAGLTAVGSEGAVSLLWRPTEDEDLQGYLVLRGVPPGETLHPLTAEPVPGNSFRDSTAVPGVRYVYAVQAVDNAEPPNVSSVSVRVDATAR